MKYLVNFFVEIIYDDGSSFRDRSSFSVIEKDVENNNIVNLDGVHTWFTNYFKQNSLDSFINVSKLMNKNFNVTMKIARITDTLSGKYKTY